MKKSLYNSRFVMTLITVCLIGGIMLGACDSITATAEATEPPPPPPTSTNTPLPPTNTPPPPTETPPNLSEIAEEIITDVGEVKAVYDGDPDRVVFIFAEDHGSLAGHVEGAIMLNRLYANYNVRHIGLEGWVADDPPMDLSWAHRPPPYVPGTPITDREDVLVYMLAEGELIPADFIGLVYEDVVVHGIDNAELYAVKLHASFFNVAFDYNYAVTAARMNDQDKQFWASLKASDEDQLARDYAINSSVEAQERIERMTSDISDTEFIEILDELVALVDELGLDLTPMPEAMQKLQEYMQVVSQRSNAMGSHLLELAMDYPGFIASFVGGMHADRIAEMLEEAGVSYVVIYPLSRSLEEDPSRLSAEAYARKEAGMSPGEDGTLGAVLDERKNPPPTGAQERVQYEQMMRELLQRGVMIWNEWLTVNYLMAQDMSAVDLLNKMNDLIDKDEAYSDLADKLSEKGFDICIKDFIDGGLVYYIEYPNGTWQKVQVMRTDKGEKQFKTLEEGLWEWADPLANPPEPPPEIPGYEDKNFVESCSGTVYSTGELTRIE